MGLAFSVGSRTIMTSIKHWFAMRIANYFETGLSVVIDFV